MTLRFLNDFSANDAKSAKALAAAYKPAAKTKEQEQRAAELAKIALEAGDRVHALGAKPAPNGKLLDNVNKIITETAGSQSRYGSSSGGGGAGGGTAGSVAGSYQNVIDLVNQTAQANNEWSAAQAQKQMDFQERMARNAHLYEVEDLKNAGLNPVLSAGGNGAATPTGAMGQTDDSNTRIIAELAASAIESLGNTAAGYASAAGLEEGAGFLGKVLNFYNTNKLGKKLIDTGLNTASGVARIVFARKALAGMGLARMFK